MKEPRIVKKKLEFVTPRMRIYKYKTVFPNKKIKDYFVLDRYGDFSVVIPLFDNVTTLLVGQYRVPIEDYSWEYPMGSVHGKSPLATAKQELKEETGFTAGKYIKLGEFYVAPGFSNQKMHVFLAKELTPGTPEPEEFEFLSTKEVTLETVKNMIEDGTIKDGPTVLANSRVIDYLNKK